MAAKPSEKKKKKKAQPKEKVKNGYRFALPWQELAKHLPSHHPQPHQLYVLNDQYITAMAKKHGITRVTPEAKDNIRRLAFITTEGIIEDAKLYAFARMGYPGKHNPDQKHVKPKRIPPSIVIQTQDIIAALKNRGLSHY